MLLLQATLFSFAVSALALPVVQKRAGVLKATDYADFQVSDGVGGNALDEVKANFPIDFDDLANVDANDVAIIKAARETAEDAETGTGGFNDAIAAAGSSSAAGKALQVGKTKNKVLKLELEVLGLQIDQAQGGKDNTDKIAEETTKLNNNIKLDQGNAGAKSQSVDFAGNDDP
ncbi:hypothetical protein SPI_01854 [Niveomyces insectorum RCEF 264]|uniref:Small secreted protein n=1 Tax=Niveomyces insectorum RCEF 264 TaxID=1081102 RepID=A0A167ZAI3_9HYPO|nr:hypothetical protein SPI_01854 [Niveomyces insectorum RCEF 264]